ncbi:MAG: NADH-quinone oxidoreductase subunit C [Sandaracinaceae bacterium]
MSKKLVDRLARSLGDKVLSASAERDDPEIRVAAKDYKATAAYLREDPEVAMDHFLDLTAVDYPERAPEERFDVLLTVRSMAHNHRVRLATRVADGEGLASVTDIWPGAGWAEREVWDMFGVPFAGHPDLRRILMYDEFEGHPLRKDYPIERTQPLVAYRDVTGIDKIPPFGPDMGQPWSRIDWEARLRGEDLQVSPAIGLQVGQRPALSSGSEDVKALPTGDGEAEEETA